MTISSVIALGEQIKITKDRNIEEDCIEFGERLEAAMDAVGLNQAELSRLMKVSRSAVNWWIQGKTYPSIENVKRLGALLRVPPEYLLFNVLVSQEDRLVTSVPVYHKIKGHVAEIDRLALPNEFIAREFPKAGELRAAAIYSNGEPGMIAIADAKDRTITAKPRHMLIDFGDSYSSAMVSKQKSKLRVEDTRHPGQITVTPDQISIVGHMVAELNMTGG